ncbi:putative glycosyltransferase-like domain-containing protein 1-like [Penaeus vannamei]|uniref:tRNA-queuosine alpha-mannosyltransferase n=1 Tax=Penaeus vannamei TaxID=6689 RepID=A0A3R7SJF7_PENVA|nr:putative glycosyltransferase-like domain-containing protein 1-like [Penaeus vannamei]
MNPDHVDAVQRARPHKVDGRLVETKRAVPRSDANSTILPTTNHPDATHTRIFIGGLPQDVKEDDLESYFAHFGRVTCVNIMYDKNSGRHRGFAFVDFNDYDPVDKVLLTRNHSIKGRPIDVKKAISKSDISKIKTLMSGVVSGPEASFLASLGGSGSNAGTPPATTPLPPPIGTLPALPGPSGATAINGAAMGRAAGQSLAPAINNAVTTTAAHANVPNTGMVPPVAPLTHPFFPRLPLAGLPGFSAQLRSGWQYSVSGNAEVLRNTAGAASNRPSGAPPLATAAPVAGTGPSVLTGGESDAESEGSAEDQVMDTEDGGSEAWGGAGVEDTCPAGARLLIIEPFYGGSHKQLISLLRNDESVIGNEEAALFTLPSKKWHWRARTAALYFYQKIPQTHDFKYNLESFLREIPRHLKLQPDHRPDSHAITQLIRDKSQVAYFPVNIAHKTRCPKDALEPLHIIWPHRWEHDKDPDTMFQVLYQLVEAGLNFRLSVLGQSYSDNPPIFAEARQRLANYITHWGYAENKEKYWEVLHSGDVVVSTAHHEFFGVAMLEAVGAGCFPLCPNRLVYPEIFPQECLYNTTQQLQKSLAQWCSRPQLVRSKKVNLDLNTFSWATLKQQYIDLLA